METDPSNWITALQRSHDHLRSIVSPLDAEQLASQAYPSEWSIAEVLSHLGSGAEIFGLFVEAALSGEEPPGREAFPAIWERWNAKSPSEKADDALDQDAGLVGIFGGLDPERLEALQISLFGMDLDANGIMLMRLREHAVHTWDVAVALDDDAVVDPPAVELMIDGLGQLVARVGKPLDDPLSLVVRTVEPERAFRLELGEQAIPRTCRWSSAGRSTSTG